MVKGSFEKLVCYILDDRDLSKIFLINLQIKQSIEFPENQWKKKVKISHMYFLKHEWEEDWLIIWN